MAMSRFLAPFGTSRTPARWGDPFVDLQREMNRMFDDVFRGFGVTASDGDGGAIVAPRIDVDEADNHIQISAELPGVPQDAVEVTIDDDVLTIRGEKRCERKDEKARVSERFYGTFQRAIQLPFAPDPGQVEARFDNGVLKVTLPKQQVQLQKSRKIDVRTGESTAEQAKSQPAQSTPSSGSGDAGREQGGREQGGGMQNMGASETVGA